MSKLTLDALKSRADGIASEELLAQISGGTANDCHTESTPDVEYDKSTPGEHTAEHFIEAGEAIKDWLLD